MIKVEKINADLFVIIPSEYNLPEWVDRLYKDKLQTDEKGNTLLPCRKANVKITKPTIVRTPMGNMTRNLEYTELWNYFDIPMKSLLVEQGDDIADELNLTLKAVEQINVNEEKKEDITQK